VLAWIGPGDFVYEIGAGDLRLARLLAVMARRVTAIEIDADVLSLDRSPRPANLTVVHGDAWIAPVPEGVTVGVLLMRHCTHFGPIARRLRRAGCKRLVTNARWRMSVEAIDLQAPRPAYAALTMGWYACECGVAGFKPGPVEDWTPEQDAVVHEVRKCPYCFRKPDRL
jgi:hypothetical protein